MTQPNLTVEQIGALHRDLEKAVAAAVAASALSLVEMGLGARLAAKVNAGQPLSTDEVRSALRLLLRNRSLVEQAGITIPGADTVPPTQPPPAAPVRYETGLRIASNNRSTGRAAYLQHIVVERPPFEANEVLKAVAHAEWDKVNRRWHTPATPAYAHNLMRALAPFNPLPSPRVAELAAEWDSLEQRRRVLHPDAPEPSIPTGHLVNGQLWGHQLRALEFAVNSSGSLIAVPMGGGKTLVAVAAANYVQARRVVIVCPNKVRGVWPREVAKWSAQAWHMVDGTRPARVRGGRRQDLPMAERLAQAEANLFDCPCGAVTHAVVWNYEMLTHEPVASWRPPMPIDMAIYDEVHRAKSYSQTSGSANLARWVEWTNRRIGLSGTPMPQDAWDIFGVFRVLEPGVFGTLWTPFQAGWIELGERKEVQPGKRPQTFPKRIKPAKQAEFAAKVHSIMYRPTIDLKLPPVTHIRRTVELEPAARTEYDRLAKQMWADLSKFAAVLPELDGDQIDAAAADLEGMSAEDIMLAMQGGDPAMLTPKNILSRMLRLMQATGGTLPDDEGVPHRISYAKANGLMEFSSGSHPKPIGGALFEAGCYPGHPGGPEPVCVYGHFRYDLDAIREVAEKAGLRYAEISGRRSDGLTDTSEMTPDADVVGVQIAAGGTGVDLTRSCWGIWYSKGHSLGNYDQALKRQDRPGQTRPVRFVHLEAEDTIDHEVYRSLMSHRAVVAGVLAQHGLNRPELGGDGSDEVPAEFDTVFAEGGSRGDNLAVRLPIDEFGHDVLGDPRPPQGPRLDQQTILELSLDDIL